ncbi:MAG: tRNA (adenosine(37)-N6)-threonylcarbamoyltransferase complex ATPase subunit type 1 TsaE [Gemmatimonadetes bacterium]|nr:tRNA (adenosine(37)-N6)-threonylcarbamoyltransferase complex ATPase subunit type 1 TsaE [Gemmatimonadota bacterium]
MTAGARAEHGTAELARSELAAWGVQFGTALVAPAVIALSGELGAGKTTLAQSICAGLGVIDPVTSPTFALVHEYRGGRAMVFHLDLYRVNSAVELENLGWDELLDSNAIVLVEWPERADGTLPPSSVWIGLGHVPGAPELRRVTW